jgi:hypothetical protein
MADAYEHAVHFGAVEVRCRGDEIVQRSLNLDGVELLGDPGTLACGRNLRAEST